MPDLDLDALDRLFAVCSPGEWEAEWHLDASQRVKSDDFVVGIIGPSAHSYPDDREVTAQFAAAAADARCIAALHNAWPQVSAELRGLRGERHVYDFFAAVVGSTVRSCRHCGLPVAGGPTACIPCANEAPNSTATVEHFVTDITSTLRTRQLHLHGCMDRIERAVGAPTQSAVATVEDVEELARDAASLRAEVARLTGERDAMRATLSGNVRCEYCNRPCYPALLHGDPNAVKCPNCGTVEGVRAALDTAKGGER